MLLFGSCRLPSRVISPTMLTAIAALYAIETAMIHFRYPIAMGIIYGRAVCDPLWMLRFWSAVREVHFDL